MQIVRSFESKAETQPKLHPAFLRLLAMSSKYFNEASRKIYFVGPTRQKPHRFLFAHREQRIAV
jgi:hypothetical protein